MKLGVSRQIFEKPSNIKFHENLSSGGEFFHADGRTYRRTDGKKDRHDEANSLSFYTANAPKMADHKFRPCTLKAGFTFFHLFIRVVLRNNISMSACVASRL
jgi:hypothetical protein